MTKYDYSKLILEYKDSGLIDKAIECAMEARKE